MNKLILITTLATTLMAGSALAIGNISGGFGNNSGTHEGINFLQDNTKVDVSTGVTTKVTKWGFK